MEHLPKSTVEKERNDAASMDAPPERVRKASNRSMAARASQVRAARAAAASDRGPDRVDVAEKGVKGAGSELPHAQAIQQAFGRHDISGIKAEVGGAAKGACKQIGADAYAMGDRVAFSQNPDLHTAAHEAAHVLQQQQGVQCKGGVGEAGDTYEQHADAVADAVVAGRSAEGLIDQHKGGGANTAVQMKSNKDKDKKPVEDDAAEALLISFPDYLIETETRLGKVGGLGHAGVLLIRHDGYTRYYEYGRYATTDGTKGKVRNKSVPDAVIGEDGKATPASLEKILAKISKQSGQNGRIDAAYFQNVNYSVMHAYAEQKLKESNPGNPEYDKNRDPYTLTGNNCGTFAEDVITQDKRVDQPSIWVNSPNNIVEEYQEEGNAQVTYNPTADKGDRLEIGEWDEEDAKVDE